MADDIETKKDTEIANKNKNNGFESDERLTLKINVREAVQYEAEKGKEKIGALQNGMKKLNKKVRDSYDEEDADGVDGEIILQLQELQTNLTDASNGDNSLLNSLSPEERNLMNQKTNIEVSRQEQNIGKINALMQADALSHQAGINKLKAEDYGNLLQDAVYNPRQLRNKSLEKNIQERTGIEGKIKEGDVQDVVKGVKKITKVTENHKTQKVTMDDAEKVGKKKMSQNETAELILKKSGQTARLSEIKKAETLRENHNDGKKNKKDYSKQMQELLHNTLKKNDKVH